jgi:hypothetical protein
VPLVRRLVQERAEARRIAREQHQGVADPHRLRIDLWHPALVEAHPERLEPEIRDIRPTPHRDEHLVDHHTLGAGSDRHACRVGFQFDLRPEPDAELVLERGQERTLHARIA